MLTSPPALVGLAVFSLLSLAATFGPVRWLPPLLQASRGLSLMALVAGWVIILRAEDGLRGGLLRLVGMDLVLVAGLGLLCTSAVLRHHRGASDPSPALD